MTEHLQTKPHNGDLSNLLKMESAPRCDVEIWAYHKDGKCLRAVYWNGEATNPHWSSRLNSDYHTKDAFYSGWQRND